MRSSFAVNDVPESGTGPGGISIRLLAPGDEHVVRVEARPNLLKTKEALDEQSRADQQHQRESDLAY